MSAFLPPAVAVSSLLLLGLSGARHLRHVDALRRQLDRQRLWGPAQAGGLARGVPLVELTACGLGAAGLLAGGRADWASTTGFGLVLALGAVFVAYQALLVTRRPGAPCACDPRDDGPAGTGSMVRAAWLFMAGAAGSLAGSDLRAAVDAAEAATIVAAGVAITVLVDVLPGARGPARVAPPAAAPVGASS